MRQSVLSIAALCLSACAIAPNAPDDQPDLGVLWVQSASEYKALSRQIYSVASRDLPIFIADKSWSALPQQRLARDLPPAIILDVDQTVVSNHGFETDVKPPFTNRKHYDWYNTTTAVAIEGVVEFVALARAAGVTVFFVTNRPCDAIDGVDHPCPPKLATINNLRQIGIDADEAHVFLAEEQGWTREKLSRRLHIAKTHRVIMLFGDDFGDFVQCVRSSIVPPCTEVATPTSRDAALDDHAKYWGHGWYVLPNPMYGSWTSVK